MNWIELILKSEAIATPIVCNKSFQQSLFLVEHESMDPWLANRHQILSPERDAKSLVAARQKLVENERIDHHLARHAWRFLLRDGSQFRLRADAHSPASEILRWRAVSLSLPESLWVAAASIGDKNAATTVRVLDGTIAPRRPVAHLHAHGSAVAPFDVVWNRLLNNRGRTTKLKTVPEGFGEINVWQSWLIRAVLGFLYVDAAVRHGTKRIFESTRTERAINVGIGELLRGRLSPDASSWNQEIIALLEKDRRPLKLDWQCQCDHRLLRYAKDRKDTEVEFLLKVWLQATRIRVALFRHLVFLPGELGLSAFGRVFERLGEYEGDLDYGAALKESIHSGFQENDLIVRGVELRQAPGTADKIKALHHVVEEFNRKTEDQQCYLVIHLLRNKGSTLQKRFAAIAKDSNQLKAILYEQPEILKSLRGLDVAGVELDGPLWMLADHLRSLREVSIKLAANIATKVQPLRLTLHCGEDFRHLIGGLRAIHEPFQWQLMNRGDRIGHGLALGCDPKSWVAKNSIVEMPIWQRIQDLAWAYEFMFSRGVSLEGKGFARMSIELEKLIEKFSPGSTVAKVRDFFAEKIAGARFQRFVERRFSGGLQNESHETPFENSYLQAVVKQERDWKPQDMVKIETTSEIELMNALQAELAKLLARWQTPIELNPSSNLLIHGMNHPLDQPIFQEDHVEAKNAAGLVLTISADDPICFATDLSAEFAYAWAGMVVGAGVAPSFARQTLDRFAENSCRASFVPIR